MQEKVYVNTEKTLYYRPFVGNMTQNQKNGIKTKVPNSVSHLCTSRQSLVVSPVASLNFT